MAGAGRVTLVVLFGGRSAEHDVSCVSAVSALRALDRGRYDIVPVGITAEGRWVRAEEAARLLATGAPLPPALEAAGPTLDPLAAVAPGPGGQPTVVLPLLHGPFGEDGTVQGLLEVAGVPYVGSGVLGSAAAMDKVVAKRLLAEAGLAVAHYLPFRENELAATTPAAVAADVEAALGWPVFVKPANLGSSVGVSMAGDAGELAAALATALAYDEWVLVEEAVTGREIECGVLGDLDPRASVPGEVRPSRPFYDYEDKYEAGTAELLVPAPLSEAVTAEVQRLSVAAFRAVRAEGMARVDFFFDEGGRGLVVNEVNTIPGFTPISMYPRMWEASGLAYPRLLDRLVELALERHTRRSARTGRPRTTGGRLGR
ncbi:MAG: D-alanine--D-alanine ligase family protein [Actinomycetota bacterium]